MGAKEQGTHSEEGISIEKLSADQQSAAVYNNLVSKSRYHWDEHEFILDYLANEFKNYRKSIQLLRGYVQTQVVKYNEISTTLTTKIIEALGHYLKGKVPLAYSSMKQAFESVKDILINRSTNRYTTSLEFGFKARVIDPDKAPPTKEGMFHIPFEKRHLVQDNRYSIHGIPSIYLGRSIYDCYCELGKPALENMWVSFFCFSQNAGDVLDSRYIRLIDLTYSHDGHSINLILNKVKKDKTKYISTLNKLVDDILLWPLIMACSIVCRYPNASFKQEYLIPQMLYQLCSENDVFTGVRYYSTKLANEDREKLQSAMINYALPAQYIARTGYCPKLSGHLVLSEPINVKDCLEIEVNPKVMFTQNGLPILGEKIREINKKDPIHEMNQMTMHFDTLVNAFKDKNNLLALSPLNGWASK